MSRKQITPTDPAERQVFGAQASIQYLRTGGRRTAPHAVGIVPGVRPFFA